MNPNYKPKDKLKPKQLSEDSIPSFIRNTYRILEEGKYSDVIRWNDEGNAIIISNPTEFAQKVLPAHFKHNNLTSFIRQLNMYDFHKKRSLNMDHVYCHELFQRGKKHLLKEIRRKNSENITQNTEKILPTAESPQTKQDLAAVVHENVLLKKYNRETHGRVTSLESRLQEVNHENQTLWNQIYQLKDKESILKSVLINVIKQHGLPLSVIPPFLQSELEIHSLTLKNPKDQKDNSPTFVPQTTTKIHFPASGMHFSQGYPGMQQDFNKEQRVNAMQMIPRMDKEFTLGGNGPLFLDLNKGILNEQMLQAGQNETVFPTLNFEPKSGPQVIDPWGLNFGNYKQIVPLNDRQNKLFMEENSNPNFPMHGSKRSIDLQGDGKNDAEAYGKRTKLGYILGNEGHGKGPGNKRDEQRLTRGDQTFSYSIGDNAERRSNIKEEGMH